MSPSSPIEFETRLACAMKRWQQDPVAFAREALGFNPTFQQEQILNALAKPNARVSAASGHGIGKSTILAVAIIWHTVCFYPSKTPCTAPTFKQLSTILWSEVAKLVSQADPWLKDQLIVTSDLLYVEGHKETQFAVARTARPEDPEALQGFHSKHLMFVIDEASGVPDPIWLPVEGALSTEGAKVIAMGNPTQTSGYFFLTHHRDAGQWATFRFSSKDSPLVSPEYAKNMAEKYGEDSDIYRVRVKGDFPSASISQLIPRELAERAAKLTLRRDQYLFAPVILGVDPAWMGDDRSCIIKRQGLAVEVLFNKVGVDNMTLAGLVAQCEDEHKADAVFIDIGWGAGVIDRLRQLGRNPIPVNFGGKPNSARYKNKRTEMWCETKNWLADGGAIPNNTELVDDLVAPQYGFCPNGCIQLEAKDDMKKRGLRSPDLGDGLVLTFAQPVFKREDSFAMGAIPNHGTAKTDYDIFS